MSNRRNLYPASGPAGILSHHNVKSRRLNTRCKCSCPERSTISSITAGDCAFPRSASPGKHHTCQLRTTAADLMWESPRRPFRWDLSQSWGDWGCRPIGRERPTKPASAHGGATLPQVFQAPSLSHFRTSEWEKKRGRERQ